MDAHHKKSVGVDSFTWDYLLVPLKLIYDVFSELD
jgi:hypothetical protein